MRYLIELQKKYLRHAERAEKRHLEDYPDGDHPAVIFYKEAAMHITPLIEVTFPTAGVYPVEING